MDEDMLPGEEEEPEDPAAAIDSRLSDMERAIDEVRDLVDVLQDQRMADVDVNVFTGKDKGEEQVESEMTALSRELLSNLKVAYAKLDSSADELAMVGETYENISKLSSSQAREFKKLAGEAVRDADQISGEVRGLIRLAGAMKDHMAADNMEDAASYAEDMDANMAEDEDMADDGVSELISAAMDLRRSRRESLLKQAEERVLSDRKQARENLLKSAEEDAAADMHKAMHEDAADDEAADCEVAEDDAADMTAGEALDGLHSEAQANPLKAALAAKVKEAHESDAREAYRVKLRRAYDVGLDMQRKGLLPTTKTALDKQVDEIMDFDDRAFESFKRSIASARPVRNVKIASDLGGVNIGVEDDSANSAPSANLTADSLSSLWD